MTSANKALEVFTDVLHKSNLFHEGTWVCNPYDVEYEGKAYQFVTDSFRAYAIPAVIDEEDFEGLPRSVKPTPPPHLDGYAKCFAAYKGEGYREIKLPTIKAMREALKEAKAEGYINRPYFMDGGFSFVWYDGSCGQHPRPVLDTGLGEVKMPSDQVIQALQVIKGCRIYAGKDNQPIIFTDGEAYAMVMPMSPKSFYKAMGKGAYRKESRAWKLSASPA